MGRWSKHPMGSDGALDARNEFMESEFNIEDEETNETIYYFERPNEEVRKELLKRSLDKLMKMSEFGSCIKKNKYVIPYTFLEYKAYPTDPKIKKFLLECLDSHDDLTEESNFCNSEEINHLNYFKDNFEDIISGKIKLEDDKGLLFTIAEKMGLAYLL